MWPNHQHLPQTSTLIGNRRSCSGSSGVHSSREPSVPLSPAKAAFPLPLSVPSTAKPAATARCLFSFYFHGPFYLWVMFLLGFDSFSKGQGSKGRRTVSYPLISPEMLSTRPPGQPARTPACLGTRPSRANTLCKLKLHYPRQEKSQLWQRGGMRYDLGRDLNFWSPQC